MVNGNPDQLKVLDLGIRPEAAVSGAVVIESERTSFLTFNAVREGSDGKFETAGTAVIELESCFKSQFGYPNDEALGGHPLASKGLEAYEIYEVENSTWITSICDQNRVCFPNADWFGRELRHFVFTFHDSTFECLAKNLNVTVRKEPYNGIINELAAQISNE